MKNTQVTKRLQRARRHARVRAKISGTAERPRVSVFKSNRHLFVQVINDDAGTTLASQGRQPAGKGKKKVTKTDSAKHVGTTIAAALKEKGISAAVFDAGGYQYHGRVRAVAEGLREGGIAV